MGHITVDSPYAADLVPGVLNIKRLEDSMWLIDLRSLFAIERRGHYWFHLMHVRENLDRAYGAFTFMMGRWDFSADVDVDNVTVRFMLPNGLLYEIPAIPEGGDYVPRRPVQVLSLASAPAEVVSDVIAQLAAPRESIAQLCPSNPQQEADDGGNPMRRAGECADGDCERSAGNRANDQR